ncbi:MAG: 50S ribosomal protein L13 [Gammaproteobacteria bacterium RIFCSPLOWO2_02_FULL_42_14]|nr:MAG: 50S ribosomal protein L13 [Gammaproteobacteria bacterium RIFCSPHIGHO2_02_FULL_42_43]OGT27359.1 MAG: 50S ribosomal protein L13 [Gammaproteobacteria bacterium RIFCSPHIGHO2_01_FULL_42_8]OGT52656.1 MAG: 50S ribosomal protein L13 [Gammaproteobacteria bacterium RIFCSPHIGHO2_12_FULL_41_25]OGT62886.1 MAG: 50S ribosomal protein L13 [Gammaproteobacteria bacterium RIFCSPLOWO2_02_FULL_42_14]OGT86943.1 MAG: 50S ribosomal protein L13 [Gammaproteobacteria bacterium RIFCSPLOWO2_12_FULL_42_18]
MSTFMANASNIENKWYVVDASGKTLGRLASQLASRLRGKHKPEYTPHADTGDYFIVLNVEQLKVTGKKAKDKFYYHHTSYPGGIKEESFEKMQARKPERVLEIAVKGMLPKGPLGRDMYRKLKIYVGNAHPHSGQNPESIDLQ